MGYYQAHCWKRDRANSPLGVGVLLALLIGSLAWSQEVAMTGVLELKGSIHGVHDPVIAEENGSFYLFSTGRGIPRHCSDDLIQWRGCGLVFFGLPRWAREYVPGVTDIWAPDISFFNGRWHLYYSLSTFGSNVSAIGLATNRTLDPNSPEHEWVDEGVVIASRSTDSWNAIDPNIVIDTEGRVWLAFGSHWDGIKMRRIDAETGKLSSDDQTLYALASRPVHPRAVEAPFIIYRQGYYYLFVSFDACCRGVNSTYNIRVGRSPAVTGPYLDREGVPLLQGGGTLLLEGFGRWRGPGHNAILQDSQGELLVYHAYDAEFGGTPALRIERLIWHEGWPMAPSATFADP